MKPAPFEYFCPATLDEAMACSPGTEATPSRWPAVRASFPP